MESFSARFLLLLLLVSVVAAFPITENECTMCGLSISANASATLKDAVPDTTRKGGKEPSKELQCDEEGKVILKPCGHRFHYPCVLHWLGVGGSCPTCHLLCSASSDCFFPIPYASYMQSAFSKNERPIMSHREYQKVSGHGHYNREGVIKSVSEKIANDIMSDEKLFALYMQLENVDQESARAKLQGQVREKVKELAEEEWKRHSNRLAEFVNLNIKESKPVSLWDTIVGSSGKGDSSGPMFFFRK